MRRWATVFRTPLGLGAGLLVALVCVLAVIAPPLWSEQANADNVADMLQGVSAEHWLGTDNLGRDLFLRVLVAARFSVALALLATAIAVGAGLLLGTAPALLGRRAARLAVAVVNIAVAFPGLLLALFFAVIFGAGTTGAVLAIGLAGAPTFARLAQTLVAEVIERDYVAAARIAGVGRFRVLLRHVLPNIAEPLVVNATIGMGAALLSFAGLSFLGLGVQAPAYDWGRLLGDGLQSIYILPAAALGPGVAVVVAGLAFNLFGEAVAKTLGIAVPSMYGVRVRRSKLQVSVASSAGDSGGRGEPVLEVEGLSVAFPAPGGTVRPVREVSFTLGRGEALGVVGESGSGKSLTALAIARLIEEPGEVTAEQLRFLGADLLDGSAHRHLLGTSFGMVFQDPATSFNPTMRIGGQLAEVAREHAGMSRAEARDRAVDRLRAVRVPAAERRARQYPHEFSGGMRQRAMVGMGMMGEPALIVADEPTTALDVTVQRQVLRLLDSVREADGVALVLISHDVTVIREVCDRVLVMYAGRVVEELPASELSEGGRHPYTRALVAAVPDMSTELDAPLRVIPGRPADPAGLPPGCAFAPRCPLADERCRAEDPPLTEPAPGRRIACWHPTTTKLGEGIW